MDNLTTQRVAAPAAEGDTVCLPPPPVAFGRYELLRELGHGGTGVVWLALDRELGEKVALKTLRPEMTSEANALRELKSEVILNRSLAHAHIVKTFDFVTDGRASAISMEYVAGTNLQRLKAERPTGCFDTGDIVKWVGQLCAAMDYAHRQRVVHRDLKPANLLLDAQGDLKVADFGIGRAMVDTMNGVTRSACGTPPFMSPQQTMGERAVPSDDIYGIGATVYDLLTGDPPFFRGAIREQTLAKVAPSMTERRKELGRSGQPIPQAWERAVAAALAKEAGDRPKTAAELFELFEGRPLPAALTARRKISRKAVSWWLPASLAVGALAAALWGGYSYFHRPPALPAKSEKSSPVAVPAGAPAATAGAGLARGAAEPPAPPPDPTAAKLRPMLEGGVIQPKEFDWLSRALAGKQGEDERSLAHRFVDARELTAGQWRDRTGLYPKPPPDPIADKLKPLAVAGIIVPAEQAWLEDALLGRHGDEEKRRAVMLVDDKTLTPGQWRAHTALAYPGSADQLADEAHWPPALDLALDGRTTLRLIRVNPGAFTRGTAAGEAGRRGNEPYASSAAIDHPYFLGVFEVTQNQYMAVLPRNPSYWRGHGDWPIDQVDWQALAGPNGFLDRLNRMLGKPWNGALVADLPTNDEWEYACRAGTRGTFYQDGVTISDLQRDPTLDALANYGRSETGSPRPVGSYVPNDWGFYDMLGNVAEWCRDRYIRGGSWQSSAAGCRIGWRTQSNADADTEPSPEIGFRLLLRAKSAYGPVHAQIGGSHESFAEGL